MLVENRIYRSHFKVCNISGAERQLFRKSHSQAIQRHSQVDFLECKEETTVQVILLLGQDGSFPTEPENHT